jgi:DNA-directed RNA polymerase specialized sigma24 family protein
MGNTSLNYNELHAVAMAAVRETASPSAQTNLVDEVAALAMEQYLAALADGVEIDNPFGWIRVAARRRAIDAMRRWSRDKRRNVSIDAGDPSRDVWLTDATLRLGRAVDRSGIGNAETQLWLQELIRAAIPDPTNRAIAVRCIAGGEKPGVVAADLGLDAPAVSSRIARIKAKLRSEISPEDLRP